MDLLQLVVYMITIWSARIRDPKGIDVGQNGDRTTGVGAHRLR